MKKLVLLSTLLIVAACEKKPVSLAVTPPTVRMDKAAMNQTLTAIGVDAEGNKLPVTVAWASSDPKVASVDATGKVTAVCSGIASITATNEDIKSNVTVTVEIPTALKLDPTEIKIAKTEEKPRLVAQVLNELNKPISGRPVTFTSADPAIATIDPTGTVTGLKDGTTTLTVTSGTLKAEAKVEVIGLTPAQAKPTADAKPAKKRK